MNAVIKASIALAVLVAVVSLIVAGTGLSIRSPVLGGLISILLFIVINIVCVVWGLRQTAGERGYLGQLGSAALIGVIASVLIFCFSLLMLTVLMPNYLDNVKEATIEMLASSGRIPEDQMNQQVERIQSMTAMGQAVQGLMGTFFTSLVVGAITAIFVRRK